MKDKGCESEAFVNCTTKTFVTKALNKCGCLPLKMMFGHQESKQKMCQPSELKCIASISIEDHNCLPSCEGLSITGFDRREIDESRKNSIFSKIKSDYDKYILFYEEPPTIDYSVFRGKLVG